MLVPLTNCKPGIVPGSSRVSPAETLAIALGRSKQRVLWVFFSLFFAMLATCRAASTQEQATASTNSGPRIVFPEPVFDFGRVESGKVVNHTFEFTNAGNQTLEIRDVWTSCGCTAATNWTRRVEPGKTGNIPIIFDSGGKAGPLTKTVSLVCNDPTQPKLVLEFNAVIWTPIDALPGVATFTFGPDFQTNESRVIRLVSNLDEPVTISEPVCTNRAFRAELGTIHEGKEFELKVTVVPPVPPGSTVSQITLNTSSPKMPVVIVTAYAIAQSALTVMPPRLRLPPEPLSEPVKFSVRIQNHSTNSLILSEPSINAKGAAVWLGEVQPGRLFDLNVSFPAGFTSQPGDHIEARIKSNNPQLSCLTVPVLPALLPIVDEPTGISKAQAASKGTEEERGLLP
jgi:hypothetical protein